MSIRTSCSWEWIQNALWNDTSDRRCPVAMVDTIVFHESTSDSSPQPHRWLFTSKNGSITRKKDDTATLANIREKFIRVALTNPRNSAQNVAWLITKNGSRQVLDKASFERCLGTISIGTFRGIVGLQCFVMSNGDDLNHLRVQYNSHAKKPPEQLVVHRIVERSDAPATEHEVSIRLRKEVNEIMQRLLKYLSQTSKIDIHELQAEFVIDEALQLWLTNINQLIITPLSPPDAKALEPSKSLPALQHTNTFEAAAAGNELPVNRCRGEFCNRSVASLPGLCPPENDEDEDNQAYTRPASRDRIVTDSGQRFQLGYKNILLARAEMPFLLGHVNGGDIAKRWAEADVEFRRDFGKSNPSNFYKQVSICANCYNIYNKIERLRQQHFVVVRRKDLEQPKARMEQKQKAKMKQDATPTTRDEHDPRGNKSKPKQTSHLKKKSTKKKKRLRSKASANSAPTNSSGTRQPSEALLRFLKDEQRTPGASTPTSSLELILEHHESSSDMDQDHPASEEEEEEEELGPATPEVDEREAARAPDITTSAQSAPTRVSEEMLERLRAEKEALQQKVEDLAANLQSSKREFLSILQDKDNALTTQKLELEREYMEQLAQASRASSFDEQSSKKALAGRQELIDNIEKLNNELDRLHFERQQEKQTLVSQHQQQLDQLTRQHNQDLQKPRALLTQQEDAIEALNHEIKSLHSQLTLAQTQTAEAKSQMQNSQHETNVFRDKYQALVQQQQAAPASTPLSRSPGLATEDYAMSNSHAIEVEAKQRQYMNEIEYLKAQVQSEAKCKQELGGHVTALTLSIEQLKKEKRKMIMQTEEQHKQALALVNEQHEQEMNARVTQITALQTKVASLQSNMTEIVQDAALAKQKEQTSNRTCDKLAQENAKLHHQLADLKCSLEDLHARRSTSTGGNAVSEDQGALFEAKQATMEAQVRELQNQTQFLESQLTSEEQCKTQLQMSMKTLQEQSQLKQQTMQQEYDAVQSQLQQQVARLTAEAQELKDNMLIIKTSAATKEEHLKSTLEVHAQMKHKYRELQDQSERMEHEGQQLKQKLIQAKEELLRERQHGQKASERQTSSIAMIKQSLETLEHEKNELIQTLQAQLQAQYDRAHAQQQDQVALEAQHQKQQRQTLQKHHARLLVQLVIFKQRQNLVHRFHRWKDHTTIPAVLERQHKTLTKELTEELTLQHAKAIEDKDKEQMQTLIEKEQQYENAKNEFQAQHQMMIEQLTQNHKEQMERLSHEHEQKLIHLNETLRQEFHTQTNSMDKTFAATQKEALEAMKAAYEAKLEEYQAQVHELNTRQSKVVDEYEAKVRDLSQEHNTELEHLTEQLQRQRANVMSGEDDLNATKKMVEKLENEREQMQQALTQVQDTLSTSEAQIVDQIKQLGAYEAQVEDYENQLKAGRVNMQQKEEEIVELTKQMRTQSKSHAKALEDLRHHLQEEQDQALEACRTNMNQIKGNALVECTAKWQRALEDLSARSEIEKKAAYQQGLQDRETEWQEAAEGIRREQQEEMQKLKADAQDAIEANEAKFKLQKQQYEQECQAKYDTQVRDLAQERKTLQQAHERQQAELEANAAKTLEQMQSKVHELTQETQDLQAKLKGLRQTHAQTLQHHQDEVDDLQAAHEQVLQKQQQAYEQVQHDHVTQVEKLRIEMQQQQEQHTRSEASKHAAAFQSLQTQLEARFAKEKQALEESYDARLDRALRDCEQVAASEQREAIALVEEESGKLITQVEQAMEHLKTQKQALEAQLAKYEDLYQNEQDKAFDLEQAKLENQKAFSFHFLYLHAQAQRKQAEYQDNLSHATSEYEEKARDYEDDLHALQEQVAAAKAQAASQLDRQERLHTILVDYKRDELLQHQIQSKVLKSDLAVLQQQRQEIVDKKTTMTSQIQKMEVEAQSLEDQIRIVSQTSSIQPDGTVNVAHAAKKRRLNEEFEGLLQVIQEKRNHIKSIDDQLLEMDDKCHAKEDQMKDLERNLVGILVEQQRQMLQLVQAPQAS